MVGIKVFIYGTLLPGECNAYVAASYHHTATPGSIAGVLVDCGEYPAAVRHPVVSSKAGEGVHSGPTLRRLDANRISGQWITVDREGLAAMDKLEEFYGPEEQNDYERIWVHDIAYPAHEGWVYVWASNRGYPLISSGSWTDYRLRRIFDEESRE